MLDCGAPRPACCLGEGVPRIRKQKSIGVASGGLARRLRRRPGHQALGLRAHPSLCLDDNLVVVFGLGCARLVPSQLQSYGAHSLDRPIDALPLRRSELDEGFRAGRCALEAQDDIRELLVPPGPARSKKHTGGALFETYGKRDLLFPYSLKLLV